MWFKMHPWVFPAIIGGIGFLYLFINVGAALETRKIQRQGSDHHISGIPFLGGIHLLIAGLISPIKWLALLCVLDYTFWLFLYAVFFAGAFSKKNNDKHMNKLEKMDEFFAARIDGYDEHMRTTIEGADSFYAYTASLLPKASDAEILDLGCGTGLELEELFKINPDASVTGIDLSEAMLAKLKEKFPDKKITLINNSYFDEPLGENVFDATVSVESLHHFTADKKEALYKRLRDALKPDGYFILTDYFAESEELEIEYFKNLARLKKEQGLSDDEFYHYDTPLTVEHEIEALKSAGFTKVDILKDWGTTFTLKATK